MLSISAGCGTSGAFFFIKCSDCIKDDCEDEGACKWLGGKCIDNTNEKMKLKMENAGIQTKATLAFCILQSIFNKNFS